MKRKLSLVMAAALTAALLGGMRRRKCKTAGRRYNGSSDDGGADGSRQDGSRQDGGRKNGGREDGRRKGWGQR